MTLLAYRIINRFAKANPKPPAGFISDKWFKAKKAELKALLNSPLEGASYRGASTAVAIQMTTFFRKFRDEIGAFGIHPRAALSVQDRVDMAFTVVGKLADGHEKFSNDIEVSWPLKTAEEEVAWSITNEVKKNFDDNFKTLGDAMKGYWRTSPQAITEAAKRALKKATPAELAAVNRAVTHPDDFGPSSTIKFQFYQRVNLEGLAKKVVVKEKLTSWDPFKWLENVYAVLDALHSEEAIQKEESFTEFDLYGMKVVVDDNTVQSGDVKKYVKYMDEAYNLLKAKKLTKVWYGTFFIKCEGCGGVNQNTGGGVGGHYHIGPNTVTCYVRPGPFVVFLLAHELGHRYWFKHMNSEQRARFEGIVRVHKGPRPSRTPGNPIPPAKAQAAKTAVDESASKLKQLIKDYKTTAATAKWWKDAINKFQEPMGRAAWDFQNEVIDAMHSSGASSTINPGVAKIFQEALDAAGDVQKMFWNMDLDITAEVHKTPDPTTPVKDVNKFWGQAFKIALAKWLGEAEPLFERAIHKAYTYIDASVEAYNKKEESKATTYEKEWRDSWDNDPRQVTPVSDYGKSNIDEAFAEVFAHYVMETDMTRDQLESMKSVLSSTEDLTISRIIERFKSMHP